MNDLSEILGRIEKACERSEQAANAILRALAQLEEMDAYFEEQNNAEHTP